MLDTYRRHDRWSAVLLDPAKSEKERDSAASKVAGARIEMWRAGWSLPTLTPQAIEKLRAPMTGWGFTERVPGTIELIGPDDYEAEDQADD
jgi:hypothetical protein